MGHWIEGHGSAGRHCFDTIHPLGCWASTQEEQRQRLGGTRVEPYPFRLIPHLQAEAGGVKRTGSHMQREKPGKKTETRERGKEGKD